MFARSVTALATLAAAAFCLLNVAEAQTNNAVANTTPIKKTYNKLNRRKHDDDDGVFEGKATWFIPHKHDGEIGACGEYEADDDWIVAMNAEQYGDMDEVSDDVCFRKVRIYHDDKSVDALVTDACPSCDYGSLDLTQVVFEELGKLKTGVLDIKWEFLN